MHEDTRILLLTATICLGLIAYSYKYNKVFALISFLVLVIYGAYLSYNLFFSDNKYGGDALVWFVYLEVLLVVQIAITTIFLLVKLFAK